MVAKVPVAFALLVGICMAYGLYECVTDISSLRRESGLHHKEAQKKNETPSSLLQYHLHNGTEGGAQGQLLSKQPLHENKGSDAISQNRSIANNVAMQSLQPEVSKEEGSAAQNQTAANSKQLPSPNLSIAVAVNETVNTTIKYPFGPLEIDFSAINGGNITIKSGNYFEMLQQGYFGQWVRELPPVELMTAYIQSHSQQALENVWNDCGNETCTQFDTMSFVVGRYSCPLEAGNRIMRFLNHLVWAIITDRVFLWGYWDKDACFVERSAGEVPDSWCSEMMNTVSDCKEILKLASWVPSWDEWSLKLNLTQPTRAGAIGRRNIDAIAFPMDGPQVPRVIRVGQQVNLELGMIFVQNRDRKLLQKVASKSRAKALFRSGGAFGMFFTYGMLFESLLTLHPSLLPDPDVLAIDSDKVNAYVLHSRHQQVADPGRNIHLDISCMNKVLTNQTAGKPCIVYAMTDRLLTKQQLPKALANFNCTAIFSKNTTAGKSHIIEHGPFAGRGYFEDIALAQYARQGFMSPNQRGRPRAGPRTSTGIPRFIIEFRRVVESPSFAEVPDFRETFTF